MEIQYPVKGLVLAGLGYLTYQGYQVDPDRILKYAFCGAVVGIVPFCPSRCCCRLSLPWPVHLITGTLALAGLAYRPDATRALAAASLSIFATNAICCK